MINEDDDDDDDEEEVINEIIYEEEEEEDIDKANMFPVDESNSTYLNFKMIINLI
jgi:hypothetical protein